MIFRSKFHFPFQIAIYVSEFRLCFCDRKKITAPALSEVLVIERKFKKCLVMNFDTWMHKISGHYSWTSSSLFQILGVFFKFFLEPIKGEIRSRFRLIQYVSWTKWVWKISVEIWCQIRWNKHVWIPLIDYEPNVAIHDGHPLKIFWSFYSNWKKIFKLCNEFWQWKKKNATKKYSWISFAAFSNMCMTKSPYLGQIAYLVAPIKGEIRSRFRLIQYKE